MSRSVRLYTATQFEEVRTLVALVSERSDLQAAERDQQKAARHPDIEISTLGSYC